MPGHQRKPVCLNIRGSRLFVLATVGVGVFNDLIVYGIVVPIIPFIILSIDNGQSPMDVDPYANPGNNDQVSHETGILLALFAAGILVGSPIFGYLGDKLKKRQYTMLIGIVMLMASLLLFMFSQSYWQLLLARFLQGFSASCVWILSLCLIADSFPKGELGLQMGKTIVFSFVGMTCGPPIGALYHQLGFKAPFIFCLIMAAMDGIMRLLIIERRNNPKEWFEKLDKRDELSMTDQTESCSAGPVLADRTTASALTTNNVSILKLLSHSRMWGALIVAFISSIYVGAVESTLTLRLAGEWNYNPSQIGVIFLAQAIPGFASGPLTGHLSDKFGAKIVVLVCTMVTAVLCALLGVPNRSTGLAPLIVILVLEGFFCAGIQSPIMSEIAAVVELENKEDGDSDGFAKSYAVFNIALAGGMLVGPLLGGFVYSAIGYFWLNIILTCALALCIPIIYWWIGIKGGLIQRPLTGATAAATSHIEGHTPEGTIEELEKATSG